MTNVRHEGKVLTIGGFGCGICENSLYYLCNFFFENKVYFKICSPYSGKEPACQRGEVRDVSVIPQWGRSLEEGTATHSSILAWRIPWAVSLAGYSPQVAKSQTRLKWLSTAHLYFIHNIISCTKKYTVGSQLFYLFWQSLPFNWIVPFTYI